jgi:hypothetical protein
LAAWRAFYLPALRILRLFAADSSPVSKVKTATRPQYHRLRRMRAVLAKIGDSLQGIVSLDVESLIDQFSVLGAQRCVHDDDLHARAAARQQRHEEPAGLLVGKAKV